MRRIDVKTQGTNQRGFTLTELIVIVGIMGILTTIGAINITNYTRSTRLKETARQIEADFNMIRSAARVRQESKIVVLVTALSYRAFIDNNQNKAYDPAATVPPAPPADQLVLDQTYTSPINLTTTGGPSATLPVTTISFTALGTLVDDYRKITVNNINDLTKQFRVTIWKSGITEVSRSEDSGVTFVRVW